MPAYPERHNHGPHGSVYMRYLTQDTRRRESAEDHQLKENERKNRKFTYQTVYQFAEPWELISINCGERIVFGKDLPKSIIPENGQILDPEDAYIEAKQERDLVTA